MPACQKKEIAGQSFLPPMNVMKYQHTPPLHFIFIKLQQNQYSRGNSSERCSRYYFIGHFNHGILVHGYYQEMYFLPANNVALTYIASFSFKHIF